jgi:hypothetical protein
VNRAIQYLFLGAVYAKCAHRGTAGDLFHANFVFTWFCLLNCIVYEIEELGNWIKFSPSLTRVKALAQLVER